MKSHNNRMAVGILMSILGVLLQVGIVGGLVTVTATADASPAVH